MSRGRGGEAWGLFHLSKVKCVYFACCAYFVYRLSWVNRKTVMQALEPSPKKPSQRDILFARESVQVTRGKGGHRKDALNLQINGTTVPAGSHLDQIVRACLHYIAEGHPVTVMALDDEIGTQEAADLLKVSRPYFVKMLDSNAIPSRKVGVQRRVKIQDVLAYKEKEKKARVKALKELVAEGQRLNLGE